MEEIAISLSGGGYRAAMFHLGTLSYLNRIQLPNGKSLLDVVNTISTISGGSITGLWYMMHVCKGEDIDTCFKNLFQILCNVDLPQSVLNSFLEENNTNDSLIRETIHFYDKVFFQGQTFGLLMDSVEKIHIHHYSANGTDFSNGIAFRFQASRAIQNAKPEFRYGFIGNAKHKIPRDIAAKIKLSEILGGIVDNQGIEPLLLANQQMTYDNSQANGNTSYPCHDLIIVSDVASPNIKQNRNFKFLSTLEQMTIHKIYTIIICVLIVSSLTAMFSAILSLPFLSGFAFAFSALTMSMLIGVICLKKVIDMKIKQLPVIFDAKKLYYLKFGKIAMLVQTRLTSLLTLAQSVFMKPIRQMRYNALYESSNWKNRLISNNVSELSTKGSWNWKKNLPDYLKPSEVMRINSDKASNMGTTLWFTESEREKGIPEALFSCGQYTICMNLLEYIEKLKVDFSNTTETHKQLMECERQLRSDWMQFQSAPDFLLNIVRL